MVLTVSPAQFRNLDVPTVEGFGQEWRQFDQSQLADRESRQLFERYFGLFEFDADAEGFDLGCGSGRWARLVAPRVRLLHCIDPSDALQVARRNLMGHPNILFHHAAADRIPIADGSQDFGYALGVLHHIPDPQQALDAAVRKLKPGGQMLLYIYYAMENRGTAYRALWRLSDLMRKVISRLPFSARRVTSDLAAALVYWPLARASLLVSKLGGDPSRIPLSAYRSNSFYTLRTDALDRFGTRLEKRFTRGEIERLMAEAGLEDIRFSNRVPYWVVIGRRAES
jgi:SAM-dependent methyltransferase